MAETKQSGATITPPEIVVEKDFDGYFEKWTRQLVENKLARGEPFRHKRIVVDAGP